MVFCSSQLATAALWQSASVDLAATTDSNRCRSDVQDGRYRLGSDGQAGAFHCLRLPMQDVGRQAARAIAIDPKQTSGSTLGAVGLTMHHHCSKLGLAIDRRLCLSQGNDHLRSVRLPHRPQLRTETLTTLTLPKSRRPLRSAVLGNAPYVGKWGSMSTPEDPRWKQTRAGARAGRGFRYQDAAAAFLLVECWRRFKIEPPCRLNFEPGLMANL